MISAGPHGVYSQLAPGFEKATGHHLITVRGPSLGDSPEAIPARLARGEPADVVILDGSSADALAAKGLVQARTPVAKSLIAMVVKEGQPKPDISTVDAFRKTLLAAKSVAYSDSSSGTYLSGTLFGKLGVADQVLAKGRKVRGPPSGEPVAAVVARGEAEIGFQQLAEVMHVPGVSIVGPLPEDIQLYTFYVAGITAKAQQPEAAAALVRYLTSPEAAETIRQGGLVPVTAP